MTWNHRVLAHVNKDGKVNLQIHIVYYNKEGIPEWYVPKPAQLGSPKLEQLRFEMVNMMEAIKLPILWAANKFPKECKPQYTCSQCGRTFTYAAHHVCQTGYVKPGLNRKKWKFSYI